MAAIYDENNSLDIDRLGMDLKEQLPAYARPQFIRILTKIDMTGRFRLLLIFFMHIFLTF